MEYGLVGWFSIWNSLDILTYVLQAAIAVMYFGRWRLDSLALSVLLALQILLLFWKVSFRYRQRRDIAPPCRITCLCAKSVACITSACCAPAGSVLLARIPAAEEQFCRDPPCSHHQHPLVPSAAASDAMGLCRCACIRCIGASNMTQLSDCLRLIRLIVADCSTRSRLLHPLPHRAGRPVQGHVVCRQDWACVGTHCPVVPPKLYDVFSAQLNSAEARRCRAGTHS